MGDIEGEELNAIRKVVTHTTGWVNLWVEDVRNDHLVTLSGQLASELRTDETRSASNQDAAHGETLPIYRSATR